VKTMVCLTSVLLGSVWAALEIRLPVNQHMSTHLPSPIANDHGVVDKEQAVQQWALGCAAVLTERNHGSHGLLAGDAVTEQSRLSARTLLSEWWGINSREDLLDTLASLDEKGHRADFAKIGRAICRLNRKTYEGLLAAEDDPETINKMRIAREYYVQLGYKSLYGWDYSRAICLCRWGYTVGYLSEEEAWEQVLPMARLLQATFDSWEDLGRNYLIGRRFWSDAETNEDGWRYEDALQRLRDMRDSPWNRYPWDLDLSGGLHRPYEPPRLPDGIVACR